MTASECDGSCRPRCRQCTNAWNRRYHKANPQRAWASAYRARCREFGIVPVVEQFTRADVLTLYGNACVYCPSGEFEELDHYNPVCTGGPHTLANVRPSCRSCNTAKAANERCTDEREVTL